MTANFGWGFLGASGIASAMINDLKLAGLNVRAVASRDIEKAKAFAAEHEISSALGSYEDLVDDSRIDIVYVSTIHPMHFEHAMLAVSARKHVLVEKPFTLNALQAIRLAEAAKSAGVMVMEAMWTRFLPAHQKLKEIVASGELGEIKLISADHSQNLVHVPRLWNPDLGGGALLDLGIYPVSFAHNLLGNPIGIQATATLTSQGVDEILSSSLSFESGAQATFTTCSSASGPNTAAVVGTQARIEIEPPFYNNSGFKVLDAKDRILVSYAPNHVGRGMQYQAIHFEECLAQGFLDSPILPISESVQIMKTLDQIREIVGVKYPLEN